MQFDRTYWGPCSQDAPPREPGTVTQRYRSVSSRGVQVGPRAQ